MIYYYTLVIYYYTLIILYYTLAIYCYTLVIYYYTLMIYYDIFVMYQYNIAIHYTNEYYNVRVDHSGTWTFRSCLISGTLFARVHNSKFD